MTHARMPGALRAYLAATHLVPLIARRHLRKRLTKGKEHPSRWTEKLGQATVDRPSGRVIWLNAVGLGEVLSLRGLIDAMAKISDAHFLVTSTTATSAAVLAKNLPPRTIHQFLPFDTPRYRKAFLDHWKPNLCVWAEQEIWPGFVTDLSSRNVPQVMVAARMTAERFTKNQRWRGSLSCLYQKMAIITAQDDASADRLTKLGAANVQVTGSLKPAGAPLAHDPAELAALQSVTAGRFVWIAAPTHAPDEALAIAAHQKLRATDRSALLIIAPRDLNRSIHCDLPTAVRSRGERPGTEHAIYLADTFGDLGLMYRLAKAAFIGGTLDTTEGHSPWEASALDTALFHGTRTANFSPDFASLDAAGAARIVASADALVTGLNSDLAQMAEKAQAVRRSHQAAVSTLAQDLLALG